MAELLESRRMLASDVQLSSNFVYEKLAADAVVGQVSVSEADPAETYTFELVAGAGGDDNASFQLNDDQLVTVESFDNALQSAYSVRVRATDSHGAAIEGRL